MGESVTQKTANVRAFSGRTAIPDTVGGAARSMTKSQKTPKIAAVNLSVKQPQGPINKCVSALVGYCAATVTVRTTFTVRMTKCVADTRTHFVNHDSKCVASESEATLAVSDPQGI